MKFDSPQQLLEAFRHARMVVLVDDDDERIGGVIMASAETITADQVNFMARNARGLDAAAHAQVPHRLYSFAALAA